MPCRSVIGEPAISEFRSSEMALLKVFRSQNNRVLALVRTNQLRVES